MRLLQILTLLLRFVFLGTEAAWIRIQIVYHRTRARYWKARAEAAQARLKGNADSDGGATAATAAAISSTSFDSGCSSDGGSSGGHC